MRVAFFGNHDVGLAALKALQEECRVALVIAHPPDPEDGSRYRSVFDEAKRMGLTAHRRSGRDPDLRKLLQEAKPDLLWITDYRYLLPSSLLEVPPLGAVNLHPSLLPKYRGRAPLNWAILKGETRLGLTAHFVDSGVDSGDIIVQHAFELREDQDVGDALRILYPAYDRITRDVLKLFDSGSVPRMPQAHEEATVFPRRKPEDGLIDWTRPAREIRDLVRAVARPYPGAYTAADGGRLTIWRARSTEDSSGAAPGTVYRVEDGQAHVQCGRGVLIILEAEAADASPARWRPNGRLGSGGPAGR